MFCKKVNIFCLVLIYLKIRLISAQNVSNTSNQSNPPSSVQPRFFDLGSMGFPNFGSGRFGNPTSNYPVNSFFPSGNQNNNMQQPQPDSGYPQNQNLNQGNFMNNSPIQSSFPKQLRYPYEGDSMNRSPNYQRPPYPNSPNDPSMYSNPNFNQGNFLDRPNQGGFPNQQGFPYQGDSMNPSPNYERPTYSNNPVDPIMYPGNIGRPYQPGQSFQYPPQGGQYPLQGNFHDNNNLRPGVANPSFQPDLNNFPITNTQISGGPYQNQPNQYYPQTNPNQNYLNIRPGPGQSNNLQPNLSNNIHDSNIQFPTASAHVNEEQAIQFPDSTNSGASVNVLPSLTPTPGNFINIPQNQPQLPNNPGMNFNTGSNHNGSVAILGKPVVVAPTTLPPGQVVFDDSTESPSQKKCVQDCPSTSEYDPVCGSNNVTYINPGKFVCARNCGEAVYVQRKGRCIGDPASNYERQ